MDEFVARTSLLGNRTGMSDLHEEKDDETNDFFGPV